MHPEDLPDPGTYIDPETGDIWEKYFSGKWYVNGMLHKPFPHSLAPESRERNTPIMKEPKKVAAVHAQYMEWRPVFYYPKYEVNRDGVVRYVENKTVLAPSMGNPNVQYYPLLDADNVVHLTALSNILYYTFPESRD